MDKLVERETATRNPLVAAPALAVQFFLIPLAVVGITVTVYVGFRSLLADDRTAAGIPERGAQRRLGSPLAGGLRTVAPDGRSQGPRRRTLAPALVKAFEAAERRRPARPAVPGAGDRPARSAAAARRGRRPDARARRPPTANRASARSGRSARPAIPSVVALLQPLAASDDAGIRKMVVYALGALPGDAQMATLRTALQDAGADVRWNAAVALARKGSHEGVAGDPADDGPAVRRAAGEARRPAGRGSRSDRRRHDQRPARGGDAQGRSLKPSVTTLSQQDRSMKVRQAALEALKVMG